MENILLFINEHPHMFFGISLAFTMLALDELALNSPGIHRVIYDLRSTEAGWSMFILFVLATSVSVYALSTRLPAQEPVKMSLLMHFFFCLFFYFTRRTHGKTRYIEEE